MLLKIGNSYSNISGFNSSQFAELKNLLSYTLDAQQTYFSGSFRSNKRYLIDKKGNFPSGLLSKVLKLTKKYSDFKVVDSRTLPDVSKLPCNAFSTKDMPTLWEEQENAVKACLGRSRGTVQMPTGTGKSLTIVKLVQILKVKTLIIVPNLGLKTQLIDNFNTFLSHWDKFVKILNIDSPELETATDYDCLIIDEAHHAAARTYRRLNQKYWTNIYYRFCFTATPWRTQEEEQILMESITGDVIYELPYDTAVKKCYIVPVEAYYIQLKPKETSGRTWSQVYAALVVVNKDRNLVIKKLLLRLLSSNTSTLCLVKEIAHGERIQELTGLEFCKGENPYNSELLEQFNSKKITGLIGTTGVLGEGQDTKPAEFIIIAGLGKSKTAFMQMVGRGVRKYPGKETCKVIIFKDTSHKWTLSHYNQQVKILKAEYSVVPIKLDL